MRRILVLPDLQVPYHDKQALLLALKAGRIFKADTIVSLGDFADCYAVSFFSKDPDRNQMFKEEVDECNKVLTQIDRAFPNAEKYFIEGNHEFRLQRYMQDRGRELWGLLTIPDLFDLRRRKWRHVPYGHHVKLGELVFTHDGGLKSAKYFTGRLIDRYGCSVCVGHFHRIQMMMTEHLGGTRVAFSPGTLCDPQKVGDFIKSEVKNWHQGFATVIVLDNGTSYHQIHHIVGGQCYVNGTLCKI